MMFWLIIGFGIAIGLSIFDSDELHSYVGPRKARIVQQRLLHAFWGGVIGFCVALIFCGLVASIIGSHDWRQVRDRRILVQAITTQHHQASFSGGFFLFVGGASGSSSTELNYGWYEKNPVSHAITAHTGVKADLDTKVELYYLHNGEQPYVVRRTEDRNNHTAGVIAPMQVNVGGSADGRTDDETWELHVPKSAILHTFDLNLPRRENG